MLRCMSINLIKEWLMPTINVIHDELVQLAKEQNLTYKEIVEELKQFRKMRKTFKSRLSLIDSLEVNLPNYKSDKVKPTDYQKVEQQHIMDFIHSTTDRTIVSYRINYTDGSYYHKRIDGCNSYTSNYNHTILRYIHYMLSTNYNLTAR